MNARNDKRRDGVYYLWHLQMLGLIDLKDGMADTSNWEKALNEGKNAEVCVAIIDNGLAFDHPNLPKNRIRNRIDFSAEYSGTVYRGQHPHDPGFDGLRVSELRTFLGLPEKTQGALNPKGSSLSAELVSAIENLLGGSYEPDYCPVRDPSYYFGAHGTASAGLVAASYQPPEKPKCPSYEGAPDLAEAGCEPGTNGEAQDSQVSETEYNPRTIRYYGINPNATIMPISTLYNHEYWPVIMALIYAYAAGANVILMPRPVMDMDAPLAGADGQTADYADRPTPDWIDDLRRTRFSEPDSMEYAILRAEKALFESVLQWVATRVPVVLAAGNTGRSRLEYPASLVQARDSRLIVAAACTALGKRASYSCHLKVGHENLFFAPSNDGQIVNQEFLRYDDLPWRGRNIDFDVYPGTTGRDNDWSPFPVVAIDIPGDFGYGEDGRNEFDEVPGRGRVDQGEGKVDDDCNVLTGPASPHDPPPPPSLYSLFGGTSAAAAITAGLVALILRKFGTATAVETVLGRLRKTQPFWNIVDDDDPPDDTGSAERMLSAEKALH